MAIVQGTINTLYTEVLDAPGGAIAATGTITFAGQPTATHTVTVNGHLITFRASGATGQEVNIGVDAAATAANLYAYLSASVDASLTVASYSIVGNAITITHKTPGTGGNSFTLAKSNTHPTISGATLTGGAATGPYGSFNVVGSSTGQMIAARVDETWEDNCVALMAVLAATLELSGDPTSNTTLAKQQRKLVNDVLNSMAAAIKTAAGTTDDRTAAAARVRQAGVRAFNMPNRPTGL